MRVFVLYDNNGIHSGRRLGEELAKRCTGKAEVYRGRPKRLVELQRRLKFDFIVNLGYFRAFDSKGAKVINSPDAVARSSNKRRARQIFQNQKVPAPTLFMLPNSIGMMDFPVVGRTTHHTKGHGFWLCSNKQELTRSISGGATHWMKYIANTREFRIHAFASTLGTEVSADDYAVLKLSEKLPDGPKAKRDAVVKNHDNGWIFTYPADKDDPILTIARRAGKQAVAALGLQFGAADVMVSVDDDKAYVLEVNSAPCLTDEQANTVEKYVDALMSQMGLTQALQPKRHDTKTVVAAQKQLNKRALGRFLAKKNIV